MATVHRPAVWHFLRHPWQRNGAASRSGLAGSLRRLWRRGGLRLKLISFLILIILTTVVVLDYFIINLMEKALAKKTFEVVETSLIRIGEVSRLALLERTYENKINLDEILLATRSSGSEGLLAVDIFATVKVNDRFDFAYFTGLETGDPRSGLLDWEMARRIWRAKGEAIFRDNYFYTEGATAVPAYRYVKPIFADYQGQTQLLGAVVMVYSRKAIFSSIHSVLIISTLITLAILAASIAVTYLLGARFTRPILTMAEAASKVAGGNLNVRLDVSTNDEIEDLGKRFNEMVQELRRKEMMQKFVSSSTIEMIERRDSRRLELGGEHQHLTLFFSDIRGFTAICQDRAPQEVVALANFYLNLQAGIIKHWGGDIDKFVGDAVMALFSGSDSIGRAINAAQEIQRRIRKENLRRRARELVTVEIGIGINHGEVVVGNIGSADRMDFTAMGSAVNLASKLCARALPSEILVDRKTFMQSGRTHKAEPLELEGLAERGLCNSAEIMLIKA